MCMLLNRTQTISYIIHIYILTYIFILKDLLSTINIYIYLLHNRSIIIHHIIHYYHIIILSLTTYWLRHFKVTIFVVQVSHSIIYITLYISTFYSWSLRVHEVIFDNFISRNNVHLPIYTIYISVFKFSIEFIFIDIFYLFLYYPHTGYATSKALNLWFRFLTVLFILLYI